MERVYSRREYLKLAGAGALAAGLMNSPAAASPRPAAGSGVGRRAAEEMRGTFVILATPYTATGAVDYDDLAAQVAWLDEAGSHGMVWPQNSSGYVRLSTDEIMRGMEALAAANRGRSMTLVLGVQRDATADMVELAKHAERLAPQMMIAMPPKVGTSLDDYRDYYGALAGVTSRPVVLQTIPNLPGLEFETDLILELARRYPHLGYVKEEAQPVFERITALVGQPGIHRVYSAMRGRHLLYDLRLGVDGIISGMAMYADVFARMWDAYRAGDWDEAREIQSKILLALATEDQVPGAGRYYLKRRGIFRSTSQGSGELSFTQGQIALMEHNLRALEPWMVRGLSG
jgi:dihydrodipicolinate synthase/N-acetylneuraminate lyase